MRKLKRQHKKPKLLKENIDYLFERLEIQKLPEDPGELHDLTIELFDNLIRYSTFGLKNFIESYGNLNKTVSMTEDTELMRYMCNATMRLHMLGIYRKSGLLKDSEYHELEDELASVFDSIYLRADEILSERAENIRPKLLAEEYVADIYKHDTGNEFTDIYNPAAYDGISVYDLKDKNGHTDEDALNHLLNIWLCLKYNPFSVQHKKVAQSSYNTLRNMMRTKANIQQNINDKLISPKYHDVRMLIYLARSIREKDKEFKYYKLYPLCFQENYGYLDTDLNYKETISNAVKDLSELDKSFDKNKMFSGFYKNSLYKKILRKCGIPSEDNSKYNKIWCHKNLMELINKNIKKHDAWQRWKNICAKEHYKCDVILPEYSGPLYYLTDQLYRYGKADDKCDKSLTEYAARISMYIAENAKRAEKVHKLFKNADYDYSDLNNDYRCDLMFHIFSGKSEYFRD